MKLVGAPVKRVETLAPVAQRTELMTLVAVE